jgi:hypothetical protein
MGALLKGICQMMIMKSLKVKYALIPVLAAILGYVLIREDGDFAESTSLSNNPKQHVGATIAPVEWPQFSVEEIALLQPFQTLKQLDSLGVGDSATGNESIPQEALGGGEAIGPVEVRAIFQTPNGAAALLGNRVVRVGDVLDDGRRVTAIHPQGIQVSDE